AAKCSRSVHRFTETPNRSIALFSRICATPDDSVWLQNALCLDHLAQCIVDDRRRVEEADGRHAAIEPHEIVAPRLVMRGKGGFLVLPEIKGPGLAGLLVEDEGFPHEFGMGAPFFGDGADALHELFA